MPHITAMKTATQQDRPTAADIVAELHNAAMPLFRRRVTLYTREADGYRELSPQRFLSWYETLTGKDAAHLSPAWAQQILASTAMHDYATELPALRLDPTADTTTGGAAVRVQPPVVADTQEESEPSGRYVAVPVRSKDIKDLIPEVLRLVRHANAMHAAAETDRAGHSIPEWVRALALFFFLLFTGGCLGAALALHLAGIIIK